MKINYKEEFYAGLDLSLIGTGIIIIDNRGNIINQTLLNVKSEWYECMEQHINDVFDQCKFIANVVRLKKVVIEGLSYMSVGATVHERTALHHMVRCYLYKKDIEFEIIPPKTLKKWITGNGNADKKQMMENVDKRWDIKFTDDNLCDAYCLARYAIDTNC